MSRRASAWLLSAGLLAASASAGAQLEVEPAFAAWRAGDILALRVSVENEGPAGTFALTARSVDSPARPRVSEPLELASGARKTLWIGLQPSREELELSLSRDGEVLARRDLLVPERPWSVPLVATLGPAPTGLPRLLEGRRGHGRLASLVETSASQLPPESSLWSEIDILVWPAPVAHELDPGQAAALRRWVHGGGRLIAGSHPEDPEALATLDLLPDATARDGQAAGWGRVERLERNLARSNALDWLDLLALQAEPPAARTAGPGLLARRALQQVETSIRAPLLPGALLLTSTLLALVLLPWQRARRAARGASLGRRRWPSSLVTMACAGLIAFLIAHFGAGHGLVLDRLDIVDVDAATGEARARSIVGLRRARAGTLAIDAGGLGRLRAIDAPRTRADEAPRADHVLDAQAHASSVEVLTWEPVLLDARWDAEALELPDMSSTPEELGRSLGALRAGIRRGRSLEWLPDSRSGNELESGARVLHDQLTGLWTPHRHGLPESLESAFFSTDESGTWGWPVSQRWTRRPGEAVLLALAPGSSTPPLKVDGRAWTGPAWTVWRVRLAGSSGGRR